jgi:hypothetical protein
VLSIWTVYDHPADYPDGFIARRHEAGEGVHRPTNDVITGGLALILEAMAMCGLTCGPFGLAPNNISPRRHGLCCDAGTLQKPA